MPAKSHGRKRYTQQKPVEKAPAAKTGVSESVASPAVELATVNTAAPSSPIKQAAKPVQSTQPAPRRNSVGRELLRVAIVGTITLAILIVLAIALR